MKRKEAIENGNKEKKEREKKKANYFKAKRFSQSQNRTILGHARLKMVKLREHATLFGIHRHYRDKGKLDDWMVFSFHRSLRPVYFNVNPFCRTICIMDVDRLDTATFSPSLVIVRDRQTPRERERKRGESFFVSEGKANTNVWLIQCHQTSEKEAIFTCLTSLLTSFDSSLSLLVV